jgi:hypothetical protein
VAEARIENGDRSSTGTMTISRANLTLVSTAEHASTDASLLRELGGNRGGSVRVDYRQVPLVWRNGSASVLLHEAVGHASEHAAPRIDWPAWLTVRDLDADLLTAPPSRLRRATFRDVPMPRMTSVAVTQMEAPFELPPKRLEILLIASGHYEPLTDEITIEVAAANLVNDEGSFPVQPFRMVESRVSISRALRGASGEPQRYPGVICSREGQALVVGSQAPVLLMEFR